MTETPLREGVVGYGPGGKPVYDGERFDQQMAKLGPRVSVTVGADLKPDKPRR